MESRVAVSDFTRTSTHLFSRLCEWPSCAYVVTEALKLLFKKDEEFKSWLGQHTNNHKLTGSQFCLLGCRTPQPSEGVGSYQSGRSRLFLFLAWVVVGSVELRGGFFRCAWL